MHSINIKTLSGNHSFILSQYESIMQWFTLSFIQSKPTFEFQIQNILEYLITLGARVRIITHSGGKL